MSPPRLVPAIATATAFAVSVLPGQESRPAGIASRPQWKREGDTLKATVTIAGAAKEESLEFPPAQQWGQFLGNMGPLGLLMLVFPGTRGLAATGDPAYFLSAVHGPLTTAKLNALLAPPADGKAEPRDRTIDRIAAAWVAALEGRKEVEPAVAALAAKGSALEPLTRAAAVEALAVLRGTAAPQPASPLAAHAAAIANLPGWSDLVIATDQAHAPDLRTCVVPMRQVGIAFMEGAIRQAQGRAQPAQLAYGVIGKDFMPTFFPMVLAWACNARITSSHVGIALDPAKPTVRPGILPGNGIAAVLDGTFEPDAFASWAKRTSQAGLALTVEATASQTKVLCGGEAPPDDAAGTFEIEIGERHASLHNRRAGAILGEKRAAEILERWRARVPSANALWVHAKLQDGLVLDAGLRSGASELRIEATLECANEKAAREWLDRVKGILEQSRKPARPGDFAGPVALEVFGDPKLTVEGSTLRAVVASQQALGALLTTWANTIVRRIEAETAPK